MGVLFSALVSLFSGSALVDLYTAPKTEDVLVRTQTSDSRVERVSLEEFVASRCPSLTKTFRPIWWMANGHLQTGYCVIGDFSNVDEVVYERTLLRLRDGGTLGLDFTRSHTYQVDDGETPIVVVLHGLTGGSHESYVRAIVAPATAPVSAGGLGFRAVVVNFRGCAGVPLTSPQLYSAGTTDDIRQAILYISQRYPNAPLLGVGFSLGANIITKYMAEEGDKCRLRAGCTLACPWNLKKNSEEMESHFLSREVYSKALAKNLIKMVSIHLQSIHDFPEENRITALLPKFHALKKPRLFDFDDTITAHVGGSSPPFPFESAWKYYEWASSDQFLKNVRVPFLALNARDDPIVTQLPFDVGGNGFITLAVTPGGGHLGWFEAGKSGGISRWYTKPVLEWFRATGSDLVWPVPEHDAKVEIDGFWTEEGLEHLGWKVVSEGGTIVGIEGEGGLLAGL